MIAEHANETNTTALIHNWNMSGARRRGLSGRFASPVDIRALVGARTEEHADEAAPTPLLLKRAGEEDWRPLHGEPSETA